MSDHPFALARDRIVAAILRLVPDLPSALVARIDTAPPRDPAHGDLTTNAALLAARTAEQPPATLATALAGILAGEDIVATATPAGPGFVNLVLRPDALRAVLPAILRAGDADGARITQPAPVRIVVHHGGAPAGTVTIGLCRTVIVADALARLLASTGHAVTTDIVQEDTTPRTTTRARPPDPQGPGEAAHDPADPAARSDTTRHTIADDLARLGIQQTRASRTTPDHPPRQPGIARSDTPPPGPEQHAGRLIEVAEARHPEPATGPDAAPPAADRIVCQPVRLTPTARTARAGASLSALLDAVDAVDADVLRLTLLMHRPDLPLTLDPARMATQTRDNPVFLVQYAHARCRSVLRAASAQAIFGPVSAESLADTPLDSLTATPELSLLRRLATWPLVVEAAARTLEPHRIAFYLNDLAGDFHMLWNHGRDDATLRFLQAAHPAWTRARLALIEATAGTIRAGLAVLGVEPVEEMR